MQLISDEIKHEAVSVEMRGKEMEDVYQIITLVMLQILKKQAAWQLGEENVQ